MNTNSKASDLLIATFGATVAWIERNGVTVRGQRPAWLDWPMVRGDEFARQSPLTPKARR